VRVVALDWSGAARGAQRSIWLAELVDGTVRRLERGRTREEVVDHLLDLAADDRRLAVGMDFSFSLPVWYLDACGFDSADELWSHLASEGEALLADCNPPFWGRPGTRRPTGATALRATESAVPAVGGIRPKSTFQIGGAGSVGTGSLRGMPLLARLRSRGFRVWPFHDAPALPVVVEIYPRLFTGPVVKSDASARAEHLLRELPELDREIAGWAIASDDAFDALVSACVMARPEHQLAALPVCRDPNARREGTIWRPGASTHPESLRAVPFAARAGRPGRRP
jgi:hypothetical protein